MRRNPTRLPCFSSSNEEDSCGGDPVAECAGGLHMPIVVRVAVSMLTRMVNGAAIWDRGLGGGGCDGVVFAPCYPALLCDARC
eukprot:3247410-Rhodomonas_salina.2